jgi:type I restriction-modification system DNA methylase subunit
VKSTEPAGNPLGTTLTASGIAKMAGVGRAAVSNWRRRYADFPAPAGGTVGSPVFDAAAVEQWLESQGKLSSTTVEERAWRHIESINPASQISDALCLAGAYLLAGSGLENRSGKANLLTPQKVLAKLRSRDAGLAQLVDDLLPPQWTPQLEIIMTAMNELLKEQEPGEVFEYLHTQYAISTRSMAGTDATPEAVTEVLLCLAGEGESIFDFTSGTGSILRSAATRALADGRPISCFGQEIKPQHALVTLLRLWFSYEEAVKAGTAGDPPRVRAGDSMLSDGFPDLSADIVVANPPFGIHDWGQERLAYDRRWIYGLPPRTESELAWVQHALSHLNPGKRAVLLMPPAASARPAGKRIRGELVRHGALLAVVALPAGLLPPVAIGLHLWVLTRPEPNSVPPRVLFVDATAAHGSKRPGQVRELLTQAWQEYSRDPLTETLRPGSFHSVAAVDLLDSKVDLTPRRHVPQALAPARKSRETMDLVAEFDDLLKEVRDGLPSVSTDGPVPLLEAPTADIADLIRSGSLTLHKPASRGGHIRAGSVLTAQDVVSGEAPSGSEATDPGVLVEAGDILIPVIAREIIARVAMPEQVGAELGPGVHLLRTDPAVLDPWFLAGVLSRSDNARVAGRSSATSAGLMRIDVRRLTVAVLPIETQQSYGDSFRRLAGFQVALGRLARQGSELAREIADGLATGTLSTG